jgi:acetyl-CoA/propionyl-CoA carboxylase biotin carboxyl carrier protein
MLTSVMIANRGDAAIRVIRACRTTGIRAIAVYDDGDARALHVRLADAGVALRSDSRAPYLDIGALLRAAEESGVDAVHPGWGFLSESAEFASAVAAAGLRFVGPPPHVVAMMGDKVAARAAATRGGVPVLPGTEHPLVDTDDLAALAELISLPLAVKASFGGGGRGMRVVASIAELEAGVTSARREAMATFGHSEVFLERFVRGPRHVEVQVLADTHGNVVHLADRDCSMQRRHQKLIEEAPAPGLTTQVREGLRHSAVALARQIGYVGAGTVEYLVDVEGGWWFLEMNTRLQVEHAVTEMITGIDIVEAQLRIAAGEPLGFTQDEVVSRGHAIEARVVAEDPYDGFVPRPGPVGELRVPDGPWLRSDFGVASGDVVRPDFDTMIGKLVAWGPDRPTAARRLAAAIDEFAAPGIVTVLPYLRSVLRHPDFLDVRHSTAWVEGDGAPDLQSQPEHLIGSRSDDGRESAGATYVAPAGGVTAKGSRIRTNRGVLDLIVYAAGSRGPGAQADLPDAPSLPGQGTHAGGGEPVAPMDSLVVQVEVAVGDRVEAGDVLVVLEAMKMELEVRAGIAGVVGAVHAKVGEAVRAGARLVELAAEAPAT